jgi:hypothetical protein
MRPIVNTPFVAAVWAGADVVAARSARIEREFRENRMRIFALAFAFGSWGPLPVPVAADVI